MLVTTDHSRDRLGLNYIYPVISRRAGGLSLGINLNTNNACNWRCIYCQVPGLKRGKAPLTDLHLLEQELRTVLDDIFNGDFYTRLSIPDESRNIRDISISGNGEPTSSQIFDRVIERIGNIKNEYNLPENLKLVLITNGSLLHRQVVQKGIATLGKMNGEVWFKLDSATNSGIRKINNTKLSIEKAAKNLVTSAKLCPTWVQTCVFACNGKPPTEMEQQAYLDFLTSLPSGNTAIKGVLLYGIARPSMQKESSSLSRLPEEWLEQFARKIKRTGITVKISV